MARQLCANESRKQAPKGLEERREDGGEKYQVAKLKNRQRKETNTESGARRRIFVGMLHSMGSA